MKEVINVSVILNFRSNYMIIFEMKILHSGAEVEAIIGSPEMTFAAPPQNVEQLNEPLENFNMPIESVIARVTFKSTIRTWINAKGEGKVFSFDMCDETGEIRATAFGDQVDKFYDYLEIGKVYYISKCYLKAAKKRYSDLKNVYEIILGNNTTIEEYTDATEIPEVED